MIFPEKKSIFSEKKKKKKVIIWKKMKKTQQNWVAGCLWHDLNVPRTCPGHGRTHKDPYGFKKIQNWTKTNQDTDISKNRKKSKKKSKKIRKKTGKNQKKCIKNESLVAYDMTWTCPGYA